MSQQWAVRLSVNYRYQSYQTMFNRESEPANHRCHISCENRLVTSYTPAINTPTIGRDISLLKGAFLPASSQARWFVRLTFPIIVRLGLSANDE